MFESTAADAAILESPAAAQHWLRVSVSEPSEGEEVGLYAYPLAAWTSKLAPAAYALGRVGVVAGFGRDGDVRRMVTTLVSNPGNSGGPVFRLTTGEAVAIHKAQLLNPAGQMIEGYSMSTLLANLRPQLAKIGVP